MSYALSILLVLILSLGKSIFLYFWHDDFSIVYTPRVGECLFRWPYETYCTLIPFLDKLFNYNPRLYYLFGFILVYASALAIYYFLLNLFNRKVSLLLSLIYVTLYLGVGSILEAYSYITSFLSLLNLLISLHFLYHSLQKKLDKKKLLIALIFFIFSLVTFQGRAFSYIMPILLVILLFGGKVKWKTKIFLSLISSGIYYIVLYLIPFWGKDRTANNLVSYVTNALFSPDEISFFLQNIGSLLITEPIENYLTLHFKSISVESVYIIFGVVFLLVIGFLLISNRKNKQNIKWLIFSVLTLFATYIPYGLRAGYRFGSTHRYMIFLLPFGLLVWGLFSKYKFWKPISIVVIVFSLIQTNKYLDHYLVKSIQREEFYKQLHQNLPAIKSGETFFFISSKQYLHDLGDFFRVGYAPSEAALSTEYGIDYKSIQLITENPILVQKLKKGEIKANQFYSFYYDGNLHNLTQETRNLLNQKIVYLQNISKDSQSQFVLNPALKKWEATSAKITFEVDNFKPVLPAKILMTIRANVPNFPLPYSQLCGGCVNTININQRMLKFLTESNKLKAKAIVKLTNDDGAILLDNNDYTYTDVTNLEVEFDTPTSFSGFMIIPTSQIVIPDKFTFKVDEDKIHDINFTRITIGSSIVGLVFPVDKSSVSKLSLELYRNSLTKEGMGISEVVFIPTGFKPEEVLNYREVEDRPATLLSTIEEKLTLDSYLQTSAKACLKTSSSFGLEELPFVFQADGKIHQYLVEIPPMGIENPKFAIDCLNYPVNIWLESIKIEYTTSL